MKEENLYFDSREFLQKIRKDNLGKVKIEMYELERIKFSGGAENYVDKVNNNYNKVGNKNGH